MEINRQVELLAVIDYADCCTLDISQINSCMYFTSDLGIHVFSQRSEHIQTIIQGLTDNMTCSGISIYDTCVYVGCVSKSGIGSIKIFTLEGYFVTSLQSFMIQSQIRCFTDTMGVVVDSADRELGLFVCEPFGNNVHCVTESCNYTLKVFYNPLDIKSGSFELFILLKNNCSIAMVDKFDVCTTLTVIVPGLGNVSRPRFIPSKRFNFLGIHPHREELCLLDHTNGTLFVYDWDGCLVEKVFSDLLIKDMFRYPQGITIDQFGYLFVLMGNSVIRIDMRREQCRID